MTDCNYSETLREIAKQISQTGTLDREGASHICLALAYIIDELTKKEESTNGKN